jgi:hypothetical protein
MQSVPRHYRNITLFTPASSLGTVVVRLHQHPFWYHVTGIGALTESEPEPHRKLGLPREKYMEIRILPHISIKNCLAWPVSLVSHAWNMLQIVVLLIGCPTFCKPPMWRLTGMTRDHPLANTPSGQHSLPRSGLAVVAPTHKYSHSHVSILTLPQSRRRQFI